VESVLREEESLSWERFVKQAGFLAGSERARELCMMRAENQQRKRKVRAR